MKLFKLLNFLDFEHYRQTGRTVTGLRYVAWPQGPAPNALWHELEKGGEPDFKKALLLVVHKDDVSDKILRREIKPKSKFDKRLFTKRELAIMDRLADFFDELGAWDMSEFSHHARLPWRTVFGKNGEGEGNEIPPDLALTGEPIIRDSPTIEKEEIVYRRGLVSDLP